MAGIDGEAIEFEWNIFQNLLHCRFQNDLQERKTERETQIGPSSCQCSTILIRQRKETMRYVCRLHKRQHRREFSQGHWTFLGPGDEKKRYGRAKYPPEGKWESVASQMIQRFMETGHPVFTALSRGILRMLKGKETVHFIAATLRTCDGVENESVERLPFADRFFHNKRDLRPTEQLKTELGCLEHDFLVSDGTEHVHDEGVSSVSWYSAGLELNVNKLQTWISSLMQELGTVLFRYKGVMAVKECREKFIFQGAGRFCVRCHVRIQHVERCVEGRRAEAEKCRVGGWVNAVVITTWDEGNCYRLELRN